uniref:Transmembrane protein 255A n=1 Tax=Fundulus heteroclitus TaxID=8078 RepID=A0A3Q2QUT2_FUNHE
MTVILTCRIGQNAKGRKTRRKRKSITVTVMLLIVSVLILIFGLAATTRTQNITVGGYYPGLILVASIVFISFGAVAAFCCAIVDGVFAVFPHRAGKRKRHDVVCDPQVPCQTARSSCNLRVKSNTCYCCDLYNCGSRGEVMGGYHEYTDVKSCQDVVHLYYLLWSATIMNIVALFLGIITAAVLGGFKDMVASHLWPTMIPPRYSPPHEHPDEKPPPYSP